MSDLDKFTWPANRLGEALELLAERAGLAPRAGGGGEKNISSADAGALDDGLVRYAEAMGCEVEGVAAGYGAVDDLLRCAAPALFRVGGAADARFLALLARRHGRLLVLTPERRIERIAPAVLSAALRQPLESPLDAELAGLLGAAEVAPARQARARRALLRERLSGERIGACWLLRPAPGARLWLRFKLARLPRLALGLAGAHAAQYLFWLLSWGVIGRAALQGHVDRGWLVTWALVLLTLVPLRLLVTWLQGRVAIGVAGQLRQRLLHGATRLDGEDIRHQGAGQLLARVLESEALESLALNGGFFALIAVVELLLASSVLAAGAAGVAHISLLLGWLLLTLLLAWRYARARTAWTDARLAMTHDLVERMVGHRTRVAQQPPAQWHDGEDRALDGYLGVSRRLDRALAVLLALMPRGWLALGLLGLAPAFIGGASPQVALALSIGGLLLAYRALERLAVGVAELASAAIAWRQVAPLFAAAARAEPAAGAPSAAFWAAAPPALEAHDLVFRYRGRAEPALRNIDLRIAPGERWLLEGPSGGGKSTLVALLTGLRQPDSGALSLGGLDPHSLGTAAWRRRVAAAPQFHDNHVLADTLAFNLLMGRRWPPRPEDLAAAEDICAELGLGELLARMPAGMLQVVGDTGWQLSHGERSRLFIARALLQGADVMVLDESFAALDPETLGRALACVIRRAPALLVVAHP